MARDAYSDTGIMSEPNGRADTFMSVFYRGSRVASSGFWGYSARPDTKTEPVNAVGAKPGRRRRSPVGRIGHERPPGTEAEPRPPRTGTEPRDASGILPCAVPSSGHPARCKDPEPHHPEAGPAPGIASATPGTGPTPSPQIATRTPSGMVGGARKLRPAPHPAARGADAGRSEGQATRPQMPRGSTRLRSSTPRPPCALSLRTLRRRAERQQRQGPRAPLRRSSRPLRYVTPPRTTPWQGSTLPHATGDALARDERQHPVTRLIAEGVQRSRLQSAWPGQSSEDSASPRPGTDTRASHAAAGYRPARSSCGARPHSPAGALAPDPACSGRVRAPKTPPSPSLREDSDPRKSTPTPPLDSRPRRVHRAHDSTGSFVLATGDTTPRGGSRAL
jgi:hypothetical protein